MQSFAQLLDLITAGQVVMVRCDLNVPLHDGVITDDTRIARSMPTLEALIAKGAKVIAVSHFGRPKGEKVTSMSLQPVAKAIKKRCQFPVHFSHDCIGDSIEDGLKSTANGSLIIAENLRFHKGEEANDLDFANKLAELIDFYVNDAFSCAHRAHASTAAIATLKPAYPGLSMGKELDALNMALLNPARPTGAVVGGAKISSKLQILENLTQSMDYLIIGGAMANTFLLAQGIEIGRSLAEADLVATAQTIITEADKNNCRILLPSDVVTATALEKNVDSHIYNINQVPKDHMILDLGPQTISHLCEQLKNLKTLLWNGPLGAFEFEPFDQATVALAQAAAHLTKAGKLITIAGGGDTVSALNHAKAGDYFSYLSTAGGAFLEMLEGRKLPGVEALK